MYDMIFKRKSFHLFRNIGNQRILKKDLEAIEEAYAGFIPLNPNIKTQIRIVPSTEKVLGRGAQYAICIYSEKKENYLMNAGYLGEQLDLYLVSQDIGTLWYGVGKPDEPSFNGLDFVIMILIAKVDDPSKFRKDMYKSKRKSLDAIWQGETIPNVSNNVRFAPSACNSQPWRVRCEGNVLKVYRAWKAVRIGIMSPSAASYFNRIDMGIFLCFLELCMGHEKYTFKRELFADDEGTEQNMTMVARYRF